MRLSHEDHHDTENHRKKALEVFKRYLKDNGLSNTKKREAILYATYSKKGHFTVDELEDDLKYVVKGSLKTTIYRTIKYLIEAGLLAKIQTVNAV